jgi:hypothetical protein
MGIMASSTKHKWTLCLSALYTAGRYGEILELLELAPHKHWYYRKWGVRALVALGKSAEALSYAEDARDRYDDPVGVAEACEAILIAEGLSERAYEL